MQEVVSECVATALRPADGVAKRWREQFQCRSVSDEALLVRLNSVGLMLKRRDDGLKVDELVQAYVQQKNQCIVCNLPMSLSPIPLFDDGSKVIDDWCLDTTLSSPYRLAHSFCTSLAGSHEQEWLQQMQYRMQIASKSHSDEKDTGSLFFQRLEDIRQGLTQVLQLANETETSRWSDEQKTLLEKKCHKTACSEFGIRSAFYDPVHL